MQSKHFPNLLLKNGDRILPDLGRHQRAGGGTPANQERESCDLRAEASNIELSEYSKD